jgi:heat shock protein HtpX
MKDYVKTIFLLGTLSVLVVLLGSLLGGREGLYFAFGISLLINFIAYFFSDKIALRSSGAKPLSKSSAPEIHNLVENLAAKMNIPKPKVHVIPSNQANAFATGRNPQNASIALTQGIMQTLNNSELEGVIAHELAHIKNRDVLIATVAAVLASSVTFISRMGLFSGDRNRSGGLAIIIALLAPLAAIIIQLAVSRTREFEADETGARSSGRPEALATALEKIHSSARARPMAEVNPAFSPLYIANPLGAVGTGFSRLFSTHPPVAERVAKLKKL